MTSQKRWQVAQEYERCYWERRAAQIAAGASAQLDWYRWRAERLGERLGRLGLERLTGGSARVIEVGSGPVGVAAFLPAAERLLVDPLAGYYASNEQLSQLRPEGAIYREGRGEFLPADSGSYDLLIIENCIDHVERTGAVMHEIQRVLRPDGILYLTVNCRSPIGYYVHRVLSRLRLDPGHPHTFTPDRVRTFVARYGFALLGCEVDSYTDARAKDLRSKHRRDRLKARLQISEFLTSVVAGRESR